MHTRITLSRGEQLRFTPVLCLMELFETKETKKKEQINNISVVVVLNFCYAIKYNGNLKAL